MNPSLSKIAKTLEKEVDIEKLVDNIGIFIDKDGSVLSKFSPQEWADYINELVDEGAYITVQNYVDSVDELEWMYDKLQELKDGRRFILIAVDLKKGKIAGVLELKPDKPPFQHNCEFSVSVRPEYRGIGLGSTLFKIAIIEAKKLGYVNIYLYVASENKKAIKLYRRLGFRKIATLKKYRSHYGKFIDEIVMVYTGNPKENE